MPPIKNPEERLWRTDVNLGRNIYALISNDVTKPSHDDPLIGAMESPKTAEDVVNTHNGAMLTFGRRYPQILASAEINPPDKLMNDEPVFKLGQMELDKAEHSQLLTAITWLRNNPFTSISIVEKLYRTLGGKVD